MRHRVLAVCCASLTLVAVLFTAHVSYACSMTGLRQSHCCCAPDAARQAQTRGSEISAACCERTIDADRGPVATQERSASLAIAWAPGPLLAVITEPRPRDPQHVLPASVARSPPGGPPIYVRTCRFLI